jgi:hypothetical protein
MRNAISPNQLVLWSHYELTDAWKPTGILLPPPQRAQQTAGKDGQATAGRRTHTNGGQSRRTDRTTSSLTALTGTAGVCGLVRLSSRHSKRPGGRRRVQPRSGLGILFDGA